MDTDTTSFEKYCRDRLSNSLITGIPKIVNTTNSRRKAFKLIVFFISIAGFIWQSYVFLEIYLKYPVIQHLTKEYPEVISAPAVTLCNRNRLHRQSYCEGEPEYCYDYGEKAWNQFCNPRTKYCPAVQPENYDLRRHPSLRTLLSPKLNLGNAILHYYGPQSQWDLIEKCTIERAKKSVTCNESVMIQAADDGYPHTCFTFFSLLDVDKSLIDPNREPENLSLEDYYSFRLNLHPEEDFYPSNTPAAYVSVHDARRLKNPFVEGITLRHGYSYRVYVTMQRIQKLPPPYETNCHDYLATWKKQKGQGRLSKDDCIQACLRDENLDDLECLTRAVVHPNQNPYCFPVKKDYPYDKVISKCESRCPEACDVTEYFMTYEIIENLQDKLCNETDVHCKQSYLDLEIKFNRFTVERLISEPVFANEGLFSYIGGYMGLWFGISLIALFDLIEILLDIILYPVIQWRKMKKIIDIHEDDEKREE